MGTQMQTKKESAYEIAMNILVGLLIALVAQTAYFEARDLPISYQDQFGLAGWMTLVSIARGYTLRRIFNKRAIKLNNNKVEK